MAVDFYIKKDDRLPEFVCDLEDATGAATPLTDCTVRFIMSDLAGTVKVDAAAEIVDEAGGRVKYAWASGDTDTAGTFRAEWEVTFVDGRAETFPNNSYLKVKITTDLGGAA